MIRTKVRPELKTEILKNQDLFGATLNLAPSDAAIFVNGMYFDMEIMDVISLLEVLRQELRIMEKLHKIGIAEEEMKKLIALDLSTTSLEYAIDIRDSAVQWINDIEYDKQYRKWSDSLLDLLRPTFPGMLRSIRRNLYNLVRTIHLLLVFQSLLFFPQNGTRKKCETVSKLVSTRVLNLKKMGDGGWNSIVIRYKPLL